MSAQRGSSPLARGTPSRNFRCFASSRFIPACAGNSSLLILFHQATAVHPRLRGELPGPIWSNSAIPRFIPACAGNSNKAAFLRLNRTVHPRLRGELNTSSERVCLKVGSSPLARGTLSFRRANSSSRRFIPACAGNSQLFVCCFGERSVHPRLRGELVFLRRKHDIRIGSSPLARG